jgi:predicted RNA-binding Zn-ribbon protein involved in translation (DUF1610 family)
MPQDGSSNVNVDDGSELYSVGCIHCGETIFKFSCSVLSDTGKVTLWCPRCGRSTVFTGNGEICTG